MNAHPVVMFEFIAEDPEALRSFYANVFGWTYSIQDEFAYIEFAPTTITPLGGIGPARAEPGWQAGRNFYLATEDVEETLRDVHTFGGTVWVEPKTIGDYHFAMFKDPAGNVVGLLEQQTPVSERIEPRRALGPRPEE